MACRPDALRGRRSLRDSYTGFAVGHPDGRDEDFYRDQRERHPKEYTRHEVTAPRVAGPRGSAPSLQKNMSIQNMSIRPALL
jgi:hypothetical protein